MIHIRLLLLQQQHSGLKWLKGDTDGAAVNLSLMDVGDWD